MAGKIGYDYRISRKNWCGLSDLLKSLKGFKLESRVFNFSIATGGAGASIAISEHTGSVISYIGTAAQVYIRASTDHANYEDETITLEYYDEDGVEKGPITVTFDDNAVTEVAVTGATDFWRRKSMISSVPPESGHHFILCDADANPDGSGSDVWGMIEENNYAMIDSNFFTPSENSDGETIRTFLCILTIRYKCLDVTESCTVTMTFTPKGEHETTMPFKVFGLEAELHDLCMELEPGTDVTFVAVDDADTGGDIVLRYEIVEATI